MRVKTLEFDGVAEANSAAADRAPEVGVETVALEVKQALGAVVAPRQLEEERREVERLRLSYGRKPSARIVHVRSGLARRRLLGRYQCCEALIYRRGLSAGGDLRRGAEGGNPRARKRD